MATIRRKQQTSDFTWSSSTTISGVVEIGESATACIYFPAAFHTSAVTIQVAEARDGTFATMEDDAGADVSVLTTITAERWQEVPAPLLVMHSLRLVGGTTSVVQTLKISTKG